MRLSRKLLGLILPVLVSFASAAMATEPAPLTSGPVNHVWSTQLTTTPVVILTKDGARKFLQIQNVSASNNVSCTLDGSTPAINANGIQLSPGGSATYDTYVPTGIVTCIGSAANSAYVVTYNP